MEPSSQHACIPPHSLSVRSIMLKIMCYSIVGSTEAICRAEYCAAYHAIQQSAAVQVFQGPDTRIPCEGGYGLHQCPARDV